MTKILVCVCLLSALSFVEVKTLSKEGHVGKDVIFKCSDWNAWTDVRQNAKYLCHSPCNENKHIIIKAEFGKTTSKDRIEITNTEEGLFVTFTNLKKSDSKKYYCGVERFGRDRFIELNLKVIEGKFMFFIFILIKHYLSNNTNISGNEQSSILYIMSLLSAEPPVRRTPSEPVTVAPSVSFAVTNTFTSSSPNNISTEEPEVNTTSNVHMKSNELTEQGSGHLPYLIISFVAILVTLMVLMPLMKRQHKVVSSANSPYQVAQEDDVYEEIDLEEHQTGRQPVAASTHHFSAASAGLDPDSLYANATYLQDMSDKSKVSRGAACAKSRDAFHACETVYSFAQQPKKKTERNQNSQPTQFESHDNDFLYSLAQLT
ncbi:uncharacterized protein LOC125004365 isoform X1 [Mugil cephalus]|uniref:uncharacterized protein LOC125004365 isoform X1 n=1 Tax=Mugil cephalus TaxID=48193 RepID=UPI001FB6253A|nr:uncharacterized protein LOC125004365 isoform X1 [Mugil cephalus]